MRIAPILLVVGFVFGCAGHEESQKAAQPAPSPEVSAAEGVKSLRNDINKLTDEAQPIIQGKEDQEHPTPLRTRINKEAALLSQRLNALRAAIAPALANANDPKAAAPAASTPAPTPAEHNAEMQAELDQAAKDLEALKEKSASPSSP